jgi:hypothetical protein
MHSLPAPQPGSPRGSTRPVRGGRRAGLAAIAAIATAAAVAAGAPAARAQNDDSATVKLIQILIAKGILTREQAASLLTQAQGEARAAHSAPRARAGAPALATAEPPPPPEPEVPKGTVRVTYVPQSVRDQIAQQVRDQVLGEEQKNGWGAPNALPEWTKRITVYGDLRLRYERDLQDPANKTSAAGSSAFPFTDFNAINQGSPFDVNNAATTPFPTINTTEDRTRFQLRARLGARADVTDWLKTDIRLATGNDADPWSENQTLGNNTNFGKYNIWLDRASALLHAQPSATSDMFSTLQAYLGRFGNPFWTSDLEYSADLNWDGAAIQAVVPIVDGQLSGWFTGGAFEVYNTPFNYENQVESAGKFASRDKYLFGIQAGVDYKPAPAIVTKLAVANFNYQNVQGKESSPCVIFSDSDVCDTDNSRPQWAQFGNTYFPLRNIIQGNPTANPPLDPQYFGLASRFNVLDLHGEVDFHRYDPLEVEIEAEYSKNLGFNRQDIINKGPQNNLGSLPAGAPASAAPFVGGDTAWMVKLEVGPPEIVRRNQWNVYFGYKHLDSDAVLDAFTDNNFHLGGTNAKGYFTGVDYGIGKNTYIAARWLSADQVSGPTYRNDVLQVDLNTKF